MSPANPLLESRKVDFVERPLVDVGRDVVPVPFLIIACKVFHTGHDTLTLHPLDITGSRLPGQIGVFAVILEIPAAERRTIDVHTGSHHNVNAPGPGILSDTGSRAVCQRPVPTRRECHATREKRALRIDADTLGTVGKPDLRNAEPRHCPEVKRIVATYVSQLLVECHLRHELTGPGLMFGCDDLCPHTESRQHKRRYKKYSASFHPILVLNYWFTVIHVRSRISRDEAPTKMSNAPGSTTNRCCLKS